jgi:hypothetical protein
LDAIRRQWLAALGTVQDDERPFVGCSRLGPLDFQVGLESGPGRVRRHGPALPPALPSADEHLLATPIEVVQPQAQRF